MQTTVLHMKRLNQTESPIFVILCVLCFQRQSYLTFDTYINNKTSILSHTQPAEAFSDMYRKIRLAE